MVWDGGGKRKDDDDDDSDSGDDFGTTNQAAPKTQGNLGAAFGNGRQAGGDLKFGLTGKSAQMKMSASEGAPFGTGVGIIPTRTRSTGTPFVPIHRYTSTKMICNEN